MTAASARGTIPPQEMDGSRSPPRPRSSGPTESRRKHSGYNVSEFRAYERPTQRGTSCGRATRQLEHKDYLAQVGLSSCPRARPRSRSKWAQDISGDRRGSAQPTSNVSRSPAKQFEDSFPEPAMTSVAIDALMPNLADLDTRQAQRRREHHNR
jgi:hypothetical protein